jgi:hypothetical protein
MYLLQPTYLVPQWQPQRAQIINEVNMNSLRWFGDTMRKHRLLCKINPEDLSFTRSRGSFAARSQLDRAGISRILEAAYGDYCEQPLASPATRFNPCLRRLLFDAPCLAVRSTKDRYDRHSSSSASSMEAATVPG